MLKIGNIILSSVLLAILSGCSGEKNIHENATTEKKKKQMQNL